MTNEIDAEKSLLGSMMLDGSVVSAITGMVEPRHFQNDGHRLVAESIFRVHQRWSDEPDVVRVAEDLESRGELEQAGGPMGLAALLESVPHAGHAMYYAQMVRDRYDQLLAP